MLRIFRKGSTIWQSYFIKNAAMLGLIVGSMNATTKDPFASPGVGHKNVALVAQSSNNNSSPEGNKKGIIEKVALTDGEVNKIFRSLGNRVVELQDVVPRDKDIKQWAKEASIKAGSMLWKVAKPVLSNVIVNPALKGLSWAQDKAIDQLKNVRDKVAQKASEEIVNKFFNTHYRKALLHSIEYTAKVLQKDSYNIVKFLIGRDPIYTEGKIDEEFSKLQAYINDFSPWLLQHATHLVYDDEDKKDAEKIYQEKLIKEINDTISDELNQVGTEIVNLEKYNVSSLCDLLENKINNVLINDFLENKILNTLTDILHNGVSRVKGHNVKESILLRGIDFIICRIMCGELSSAMSGTYFDDLFINSSDVSFIKTAAELNAIPGVGRIAFSPLVNNSKVMFNFFDNKIKDLRKSAKDLLISDISDLELGIQSIDANISQVKTEHRRFSSFIKQTGKDFYDNLSNKVKASILSKSKITTPKEGEVVTPKEDNEITPKEGEKITTPRNQVNPFVTPSTDRIDTLWYDVIKDCIRGASDKQAFVEKILLNTSKREALEQAIFDYDASVNNTQLSNFYLDYIIDGYKNVKYDINAKDTDDEDIEGVNFFQKENITSNFINILSNTNNEEKIQTISNMYIRAIMQRSFTKDYERLSEFLTKIGRKDAVLKIAVLYNVEKIKNITKKLFGEDSGNSIYYKNALKLQFYSMCRKLPKDLKPYLESIINDVKVEEVSDGVEVSEKQVPTETDSDDQKTESTESTSSEISDNTENISKNKGLLGGMFSLLKNTTSSATNMISSATNTILTPVKLAGKGSVYVASGVGKVLGKATKYIVVEGSKIGTSATGAMLDKVGDHLSSPMAKALVQFGSGALDGWYSFLDAFEKGKSWGDTFKAGLQGGFEGLDKIEMLKTLADDAITKGISNLKGILSNTTSNLDGTNTDSKIGRLSLELGASLNELCDSIRDELVSLKFSKKIEYINDLKNTFNNICVLQKMYSNPTYYGEDNNTGNDGDIVSAKFLDNKEIEKISEDLSEYLWNIDFIPAEVM